MAEEGTNDTVTRYLKALLIIALFYFLLTPVLASTWADEMPEDYQENGLQSSDLAHSVFEGYGLPFFILGFVLISAVVGGMFLAKDELRTRRWGK
jgi:NADH:ubiquinone oxidoreductase subunit 6 (subunit J)